MLSFLFSLDSFLPGRSNQGFHIQLLSPTSHKKSETKLTADILKENQNTQKVKNKGTFLIKQDQTMYRFWRNFLFIRQTNKETLQLMVDL